MISIMNNAGNYNCYNQCIHICSILNSFILGAFGSGTLAIGCSVGDNTIVNGLFTDFSVWNYPFGLIFALPGLYLALAASYTLSTILVQYSVPTDLHGALAGSYDSNGVMASNGGDDFGYAAASYIMMEYTVEGITGAFNDGVYCKSMLYTFNDSIFNMIQQLVHDYKYKYKLHA